MSEEDPEPTFAIPLGTKIKLRIPDSTTGIYEVRGHWFWCELGKPLLRRYLVKDPTGMAMIDAEVVEDQNP